MHTKAWAAGLFEGEGSISKRRPAEWLWQVAMTSTDEDVVRTFARVVKVGTVYGPYEQANREHKQYWRWCVSDKAGIEEFGRVIGPFLHGRRRQRLKECLDAVKKTPIARGPRPRKKT